MQIQEFVYVYRKQIGLLLLGVILLGLGLFFSSIDIFSPAKVEVISSDEISTLEIVVDVSGAVREPGVYSLSDGTRISDALTAAGGVDEDADVEWIEKNLNKAALLQDAQKIYIPERGEKETVQGISESGKININTASLSELESLRGIGRVTAENIAEHRPYSSVEELLSRSILKKNVYEENKEKLTVY